MRNTMNNGYALASLQTAYADGFAAAQYVSNFMEVEGIKLPPTRRAYMRAGNLTPLTGNLMVSIDLSDFKLW